MKLEEVKDSYSQIADKYDRILDFWFGKVLRIEKYRREAVEWLSLSRGDTVLDIGCGTGVNFPLIMKKVGSDGKIIGVDYTPEMLMKAEERVRKHGWTNVELIRGDAVKVHKLVKEKVDAVISTYCFSILYDVKEAFRNTMKVLKDGGRFVIVDAKRLKPENKLVRVLTPFYVALLRRYHISGEDDIDEYIVAKKFQMWDELTRENLVDIKYKEFLFGIFFIFYGRKPNG